MKETIQPQLDLPQAKTPNPQRKLIIAGGIMLALVLLGLAVGFVCLRGKTYTIVLDEQDIQQRLDLIFPIQRSRYLVLTLTLSNPKVALEDGCDRITFGLDAKLDIGVGVNGKKIGPLTGTSTITTGVRYDPNTYTFYLDDPLLDELVIQGIPVKYTDKVNKLATRLAKKKIHSQPIYQLTDRNIKEKAAKMILKGLEVRDGKLDITLGL